MTRKPPVVARTAAPRAVPASSRATSRRSGSRRASTTRGDATRDRIVKAARKLAVQHGPAGLTLRAVATEAGIVLSNLQFHFRSQDDLLRAVLDAELEAGNAAVAHAVGASPADPAGAAIDALLALQHERGAARLFFSLWTLATTSRPLRAALHSFYRDWIAGVSALAASEVREQAWLFVALVEGASLFRCGVTGSVNASQERLLRSHLRALVGHPAPVRNAGA